MRDLSLLLFFVGLVSASSLDDQDGNLSGAYGGRQLVFPKYSYTRSSQIENRLKSLSNSCATKTECFNVRTNADKQNCVLKCVSSKCYDEIYEFDPLEEGEIDQRYASFKGCFVAEKDY